MQTTQQQTTQQQTSTKPNLFEEGLTRGSNTYKIVHILAIVVAQTKEPLYMSDTSGCGPFTNSHQVGQVYADLAMANYVVQVIDLALEKCTFLHLCTELVSVKVGQDGMEVV